MIAVSVAEHKRAKAVVAEVIEQLDKKDAIARIDIEEVGVNVCLYSANRLRKLNYTLTLELTLFEMSNRQNSMNRPRSQMAPATP